jgi:ATPase family associated with various cellular activities (AAA)
MINTTELPAQSVSTPTVVSENAQNAHAPEATVPEVMIFGDTGEHLFTEYADGSGNTERTITQSARDVHVASGAAFMAEFFRGVFHAVPEVNSDYRKETDSNYLNTGTIQMQALVNRQTVPKRLIRVKRYDRYVDERQRKLSCIEKKEDAERKALRIERVVALDVEDRGLTHSPSHSTSQSGDPKTRTSSVENQSQRLTSTTAKSYVICDIDSGWYQTSRNPSDTIDSNLRQLVIEQMAQGVKQGSVSRLYIDLASLKSLSVLAEMGEPDSSHSCDFWNLLLASHQTLGQVELAKRLGFVESDDKTERELDWLDALRKKTVVVISASTLRHHGSILSRRHSIEQTTEDIVSEFSRNPLLKKLEDIGHVVIRFGVTAVFCRTDIKAYPSATQNLLAFDPNAWMGVYREPETHGRMTGKNSAIIASFIRSFNPETDSEANAQGPRRTESNFVEEALRWSVIATQRVYEAGIDECLFPKKISTVDPKFPWESLGARANRSMGATVRNHVLYPSKDSHEFALLNRKMAGIAVIVGPSDELARNRIDKTPAGQTGTWQILRQAVEGACLQVESNPPAGDSRKNELVIKAPRLNIAVAIAMLGLDQVINKRLTIRTQPDSKSQDDRLLSHLLRASLNDEPDDVITLDEGILPRIEDVKSADPFVLKDVCSIEFEMYAPVLRFEKQVAVERDEIESFRNVRNILMSYMERDQQKPLSIAVFGPPGSGKSFAVKQIFGSIPVWKGQDPIELNMAQFRDAADLSAAIARIQDANLQRKTPLVFFDEFDSSQGDQPLVWLKQFLGIMQDGAFSTGRDSIRIGKAVFVFAGGD